MAKKKDWIDRLKRFFGSDTKSKQEKKKKRKLWLFGRLKSKLTTALPAPPLSGAESLRDAEEAQNKQAMAVAVVAAAAAEAAVAAAQAAAQVVRLRGTFLSYHRSQGVAAIRIQTAFRGHLARKALRALRGLVRLQALIRGQVVRRQTAITLRSLQSLMKIQSEARATRGRMGEDHLVCEDKIIVHGKTKKSQDTRTMERRNSKRPSTPTAQETFVMNHSWSWLEWVGSQPLDTDIPQNPSPSPDKDLDDHHLKYFGRTRRSFNGRRASSRDADSITSFPSLPSYMAATESAKARFRSLSTPKQRVGPRDAFSEYHCSPSSNRLLSPFPSIVSEAGRSPTFCRRSEPVKSRRRCKYLSFDSECTLLNWDRHKAFT